MPANVRQRVVSVVALCVLELLLAALIGRVVQLQLSQGPKLRTLARRQQVGKRPLLARRGTIRDCQGRILAGTSIQPSAFVDPNIVQHPDVLAMLAGSILHLDPEQITVKINSNRDKRFVWLKRRISKSERDALSQQRVRGLGVIDEAVRHYPMGPLAAHVLGYVSRDNRGLDGLELKYDAMLKGQDGREQFVEDAAGRPIWLVQNGYKEPVDGQHLILTLDAAIQAFAEQALAEACEKYRAACGSAIVMDPKTGEILAMANWPAFDPNRFFEYPSEVRRNRAITDPYEPGSVFKPFVAAAALAAGVVQWDEVIYCHQGSCTFGRRVLHDHHPYGDLSFQQIVVHSSNIGMAVLGQRLGNRRLYQAVRNFGFGSRLGVDMPGESPGIVLPFRAWTQYSTTSVPMGQEIATTTLQLITAFAALANDGLMCRPKIVRGIIGTNGQVVKDLTEPQIIARVFEPQIARAMVRGVLRAVVAEGTGRRAEIPGMEVFGKTGTAQIAKPGGGGYLRRKYVASFMGGAPVWDPQVVALVSIREPDPNIGYYGGTVAAPAVKAILAGTLDYLGFTTKRLQRASHNVRRSDIMSP